MDWHEKGSCTDNCKIYNNHIGNKDKEGSLTVIHEKLGQQSKGKIDSGETTGTFQHMQILTILKWCKTKSGTLQENLQASMRIS